MGSLWVKVRVSAAAEETSPWLAFSKMLYEPLWVWILKCKWIQHQVTVTCTDVPAQAAGLYT